MLLYLYDLFAKNPKMFNRTKRKFYYHIKKSILSTCALKTKSAIYIDDQYEMESDAFFKRFAGHIEVHKVRCQSVERIV